MMKSSRLLFLAGFIAALSNTMPANSFVLRNGDYITYLAELVEDNDIGKTHRIELFQGDAIMDLCANGCFVRFNGAEYKFSGQEELIIRDGELIDISSP